MNAPTRTEADPFPAAGRRPTERRRARGTPSPPPPLCAAEGPAGGATAVPGKRPLVMPLGTLLAGHVLHDGEVVLLILKPSLWLIVFSVMRFAAGVGILLIGAKLWLGDRAFRLYVEAGAFALAGRAMWAVLQWMGRLYVLTDYRLLRLGGVFNVEVFDCPLRKVALTRVVRSFRERLSRLGSIEIIPGDDHGPPGVWQTIRRPREVHEQVLAAIRRAKSGGTPSPEG